MHIVFKRRNLPPDQGLTLGCGRVRYEHGDLNVYNDEGNVEARIIIRPHTDARFKQTPIRLTMGTDFDEEFESFIVYE